MRVVFITLSTQYAAITLCLDRIEEQVKLTIHAGVLLNQQLNCLQEVE